MKKKISTIVIILVTLILAGVAIFTAIRLYQLRQVSVAPNVPSSKPKAQEVTPTTTTASACTLSFTLTISSSTPTPTATSTSSSSPTPTSTSSASATATSTSNPTGTPNSCGGSCGSNSNCGSSLICYQGSCRNPSCVAESDCTCGGATNTPAPSQPTLPQSGTSWPTIVGAGLGILVILGSLLLAL